MIKLKKPPDKIIKLKQNDIHIKQNSIEKDNVIEWWSKEISSYFSIPSSDVDINIPLNINFGLSKHNNDFNTNYFFNDLVLNNLIFDKNNLIDVNNEEKKINDNFEKQIKKINECDKFDDKKKTNQN